MQLGNRFARIATTSHTDFVKPVAASMISNRECERQGVLNNDRISANISLAANAAELVHARVGADICAVFDNNMASERRRIRHDHVVAESAVMRHMRLRHQEAVIAEFGQSSATCRATMNGNELSDSIVPPNPCFSILA